MKKDKDISQSINAIFKQQGATLIVAMVMLLLITMIALTSMQGTAMQQHMSGNMKDRNIAFQSAEVGLRVAEQWLDSIDNPPPTYSYSLKCPADNACRVFKSGAAVQVDDHLGNLKTVNKWLDKSLDITKFDGAVIAEVSEQPRITVELVESQTDGVGIGEGYGGVNDGKHQWKVYRSTVRSTGGSGSAEVILQSHYAVQYN